MRICRGWLGVLLLGSVCLPVLAESGYIQVQGQAQRQVIPDRARLSVRVQQLAETPQAAKAQVDDTVARLLGQIRAADGPFEALQAGHLSLGPKYRFDQGERSFLGYEATRSLSLEVAAESVGGWLALLAENGVTEILPPEYLASGAGPRRLELYRLALDDALARAEALTPAGQSLGPVLEVVEQVSPQLGRGVRMEAMADAGSYSSGPLTERALITVKVALQ